MKAFRINKSKSTNAYSLSLTTRKGGIKKPLKTTSINETKRKPFKVKLTSKKRYQRRKTKHEKELNTRLETNKKHIKNLSDKVLTNEQISLLGKGLKFIPTPVTNETQIKKQLLRDFDQFARRMRLQYIYHGEDKEPHPFHVKSTWNPPVQPSVALESYLEEVKIQLAEIKLTTPKNNLNPAERDALKALKRDTKINLKKADKGTTTVMLSVEQKIREGQNQLNNEEHSHETYGRGYKAQSSPINKRTLPGKPHRRNDKKVALSNTRSTSYPYILHTYQDT